MADIDITALTGFAANLKLFGNAAGNGVEWAAGMKITTSTREMDAATGDVAYTGVGFKPNAMVCLGIVTGTTLASISICQGVAACAIGQYSAGGAWIAAPYVFYLIEGAGKDQSCTIKTLDAGGATLAWTRTGATASATANLYFLWFR